MQLNITTCNYKTSSYKGYKMFDISLPLAGLLTFDLDALSYSHQLGMKG